jgi:hypothetical protein
MRAGGWEIKSLRGKGVVRKDGVGKEHMRFYATTQMLREVIYSASPFSKGRQERDFHGEKGGGGLRPLSDYP